MTEKNAQLEAMSDVGDDYRALRELYAEKRKRNLESAIRDGWHLHTEYHWSRTLNGRRLDYWPSRNKWRYGGRVMCGDVLAFIKKSAGIDEYFCIFTGKPINEVLADIGREVAAEHKTGVSR